MMKTYTVAKGSGKKNGAKVAGVPYANGSRRVNRKYAWDVGDSQSSSDSRMWGVALRETLQGSVGRMQGTQKVVASSFCLSVCLSPSQCLGFSYLGRLCPSGL
jgi:hypothetical protein